MKISTEKTPILESEPLDKVFDFLMKLYFYLGFVAYLPYFLIQGLEFFPLQSNSGTVLVIIICGFGELLILFSMDIIGMQSNYLDRISRLIPLIWVLIGTATIIYQVILIGLGWEDNYPMILILGFINMVTFGILGWYFVRQEYGLTRHNILPSMNDSMACFLISGILFFFEFFLPGALLIGIALSFIAYPFIIVIWGHPKVIPVVKPRKLVNPYKRATFTNFIIDMVKAASVLITILVVIYDGSVILYPLENDVVSNIWIRNLALVLLFAALGMFVYSRTDQKLKGLFIVFLIYILTFFHFLLVVVFNLHVWWIIAPLNGFTLAGVFFFIEQKIYKSDNVRVMSGAYYALILIIIVISIILRADPEGELFIDYGRLIVSIVGLAYLLGYLRESPKPVKD